MTPEQARAYRRRWQLVNAAERAELRSAGYDVKLRQLAALMASVEALGWSEALQAEEEAVRQRWRRLRRALLG